MSRAVCGRPLPGAGDPCPLERAKGKQRCHWHWLLAQSSDTQAQFARQRLERAQSVSGFEHVARVPKEQWPPGKRWCAGCQTFVPLFYTTGSRCRACASMAGHARSLEKVYGIDAAEYERLLAAQGGRCAICRNRPRTIRFAVDHDHKTGAVRGILCKRCNHDLLGGGHDDIDMLFRALAYLLYPPAERDVTPPWRSVLRALEERFNYRDLIQNRGRESEPPPF